jgi:DNA-binding PadR family transcriptional regulator
MPKAKSSGAVPGGDPAQALLPLTPLAFEILLALGDGERHGYDILRGIEVRSGGRVAPHPGTLYRAIARLLEDGLIEERDERPVPELDDARRRYYGVTRRGLGVARAEAARLESQLGAARRMLRRARPVS